MFRYLCVLTPSAADAEDWMLRAFLAVCRGAATFRSEASPNTWRSTIARLPLAEMLLEELGWPLVGGGRRRNR